MQENAQNPAKEPRTERRHRQNQPLEPHRFRHHADVILVPKGLRPRYVQNRIFCNSALLNGDFSHIFHMNGLNRIVSKAKHAEDWKPPQHPRDVVDEHVPLPSKQHGRPQNGVGQPRGFQHVFNLHFPFEIRPIRRFGRIGHRKLDDALHARFFGRFVQSASVFHGRVVGKLLLSLIVANPVGVVENLGSPKRIHQTLLIVEIQPVNLDSAAKRVVPPHGVGQGTNMNVLVQQMMRNPPARIPERTGHHVQGPLHGDASSTSPSNPRAKDCLIAHEQCRGHRFHPRSS